MSSTSAQILPTSKRRWTSRFSLRTFLLLIGLLGIALGYVGNLWLRVQKQRRIVAKVEAAGGRVQYHYQFGMGGEIDSLFEADTISTTTIHSLTSDGRRERTRITASGKLVEVETPPGPELIRWAFGDDVFASVESVNFAGSNLTANEFAPVYLRELPDLKVVFCAPRQVNDEWLRNLAQVPKLRVLSLVGGDEGTASSDGLALLRASAHLHSLSLLGEWVENKTITSISALRQLRSLGLFDVGNASSAIFADLDGLSELEFLFIFRAKGIDDHGTLPLSRLTKIKTLALFSTSISDDTMRHIAALRQLESLNVGNSLVGDSGMGRLSDLRKLRRLAVMGNRISDVGIQVLVRLPNLESLDLSNTDVSDDGMHTIAQLTQLSWLELWGTTVTDQGLLQLKSLKSLKRLTIGPHVTKEGAAQLRQALPDCEVLRLNESGSSYPDD